MSDRWHFDEARHFDREQEVLALARSRSGRFILEVLVQSSRNAKASKRPMLKLLKGKGCAPRVMIIDRLAAQDIRRFVKRPATSSV